MGAIVRRLQRAARYVLTSMGLGTRVSEPSGSRALFSRTLAMPTARDAGEAREVVAFLRESVGGDGELAWRPGRTKSWITVYDVAGQDEQCRVIKLLRAERESRGWKPICVRFETRGRKLDESLVGG